MDVNDDWIPGEPCPACDCESFIFTEETSRRVWFSDGEHNEIGFGEYVTTQPQVLQCSECWLVIAREVSLETLRDTDHPDSE